MKNADDVQKLIDEDGIDFVPDESQADSFNPGVLDAGDNTEAEPPEWPEKAD